MSGRAILAKMPAKRPILACHEADEAGRQRAVKIGQCPLLFVRRTDILLQRGSAIPSRYRRPPWAFPP